MKHAAKRGWCSQIVLERPEKPPGRVRWLVPELADRLIEACSEHLRPLVIGDLPALHGARMGEALWLDWRYIDLRRGHVTFPVDPSDGRRTKNNEPRGVPLHPRVRTALANLGLTGKGRSFVGRMACLTSDCATTRTTRPRGTALGRRSPLPVGAQVSRISRRTVVVTLGRRGITPRTATCSRCNDSAAGSRSPW